MDLRNDGFSIDNLKIEMSSYLNTLQLLESSNRLLNVQRESTSSEFDLNDFMTNLSAQCYSGGNDDKTGNLFQDNGVKNIHVGNVPNHLYNFNERTSASNSPMKSGYQYSGSNFHGDAIRNINYVGNPNQKQIFNDGNESTESHMNQSLVPDNESFQRYFQAKTVHYNNLSNKPQVFDKINAPELTMNQPLVTNYPPSRHHFQDNYINNFNYQNQQQNYDNVHSSQFTPSNKLPVAEFHLSGNGFCEDFGSNANYNKFANPSSYRYSAIDSSKSPLKQALSSNYHHSSTSMARNNYNTNCQDGSYQDWSGYKTSHHYSDNYNYNDMQMTPDQHFPVVNTNYFNANNMQQQTANSYPPDPHHQPVNEEINQFQDNNITSHCPTFDERFSDCDVNDYPYSDDSLPAPSSTLSAIEPDNFVDTKSSNDELKTSPSAEEKNFKCPICGNRYKYEAVLANHLRKHNGEKKPQGTQLTPLEKVLLIKERESSKISQRELAKQYNISKTQVYLILKNKRTFLDAFKNEQSVKGGTQM